MELKIKPDTGMKYKIFQRKIGSDIGAMRERGESIDDIKEMILKMTKGYFRRRGHSATRGLEVGYNDNDFQINRKWKKVYVPKFSLI